jgi:hypothetical protein
MDALAAHAEPKLLETPCKYDKSPLGDSNPRPLPYHERATAGGCGSHPDRSQCLRGRLPR